MPKNIIESGIFNLGSLGGDGASDQHWDDVTLLLNGEDATISDVSSASTALVYGTSVSQSTSVYKYGSGSLTFSDTVSDAQNYISYSGPTLSGDFTLETWWRPDALPTANGTDEIIWETRAGSSSYPALTYSGYQSGGANYPAICLYANAGFRIASTTSLSVDTWYHVALVRSGGIYELFVDGVSQGTWNNSTTLNATTHYIGRRWTVGGNGSYYSLNADLDDFRFTPGVARYTGPFDPPTASFPTTGASTTRPTRRWGGITGRSLVTPGGNLPTTGVLSLAEMLQASSPPLLASILMVAGGGGGGTGDNYNGGGGGGGAGAMFYTNTPLYVSGQTLNITVGTGGAGAPGGHGGGTQAGTSGTATTLQRGSETVISAPGGGGAQLSGGSGGGAVRQLGTMAATANSTVYSDWDQFGNSGGAGTLGQNPQTNDVSGAGGGGGGGTGYDVGETSPDGFGGSSKAWPLDNIQYAGGGGGGRQINLGGTAYVRDGGGAGAGAGAAASNSGNRNGEDATIANRGSGGGAGATDNASGNVGSSRTGGDGSDGVVKIFVPETGFTGYTTSGLTVSADTSFTRSDTSVAGTLLSITAGSGTITFGQPTTPASFSFVGYSYERSTTNTTTKTFTAPSGAQAGDVLVAFSCVDSDTYVNGWSTNQLGAAEGEYSTSSEFDGWRWQGATNVSGGTAFQNAQCLARVLPSDWDPNTDTDAWTITWNSAKRSAGVILAFRPSSPITGFEKTGFAKDHGTSGLNTALTAVDAGLTDVAVGPRLYLYLLSGKPHAGYIEDPDPTFPSGQGWVHTDGDGVGTADQMDFAYKLSDEGDAFVSTTITTDSDGQQIAHLYCFTMTT